MLKPSLILLFATIPLVPEALGMAHFVVNGGLNWPMRWSNEAAVWGALFSSFGFLSLYIAIRSKYYLLALLPTASLALCWIMIFGSGIGPSSKSDVTNLELLAFWTDQWGYW